MSGACLSRFRPFPSGSGHFHCFASQSQAPAKPPCFYVKLPTVAPRAASACTRNGERPSTQFQFPNRAKTSLPLAHLRGPAAQASQSKAAAPAPAAAGGGQSGQCARPIRLGPGASSSHYHRHGLQPAALIMMVWFGKNCSASE